MESFHKFLDHTADVLFVAKAGTVEDLFKECAIALEETMVDIKEVKPKKKIKILGEGKKIDDVLFNFLDDLIFFKDYKQMVFSKFEISIEEKEGTINLTCFASGEPIDFTRHDPKVDVKAVTMHLFKVEQVKDAWKAQVLLDI
jgi:SHS2 domain-containing protein